MRTACFTLLWATLSTLAASADEPAGPAWPRHTIDAGSRGADGVRVADVNGDRLPDLVTGWEEGGQVRICFHPGAVRVRDTWPHKLVGKVRSPEDAVFVDLDDDGQLDVVSSCEGREKSIYFHWNPALDNGDGANGQWKTEAVPATRKAAAWMFCLPQQIDGAAGIDLVLGAKGSGARVGWLQSPDDPRRLDRWKWHPIYDAGWIMSLRHADLDGDGDDDIVLTDRKGAGRGCWWLENPGSADAAMRRWKKHLIGGAGREVMFMDLADIDGDGLKDAIVAVRDGDLMLFTRSHAEGVQWQPKRITLPDSIGAGKAAAAGDIDGDGDLDIVMTCGLAKDLHGVFWLRNDPAGEGWSAQAISGKEEGVKFDRIEMLDLDEDGDLDVVTCEERDNLGVIWYENPQTDQ